ncbi:hypothetical protein [Micromonospora sp. NPDC047074]|uniref:hypothetical protein n=1 Tax=Micromonospora sp. NPDC047074 TaxID=3154339 RepID=UPI0034055C49
MTNEKGLSMLELDDYWVRLKFRIYAKFQGFDDQQLRRHWCDGPVTERYDLLPPQPRIRGRAWSGPDGQEPWAFTLIVDRNARLRADINWRTGTATAARSAALANGPAVTEKAHPRISRRVCW